MRFIAKLPADLASSLLNNTAWLTGLQQPSDSYKLQAAPQYMHASTVLCVFYGCISFVAVDNLACPQHACNTMSSPRPNINAFILCILLFPGQGIMVVGGASSGAGDLFFSPGVQAAR